ncbi:hypothetical protein SXHG_00071 [Synechococcus phage MRHenn-2013a]|nr:hypothetical protein SXHG_00071 [Synechococcus phage MRHenn-2013a]
MYAPYVKTTGYNITATASQVVPYTPDRSYLAIFNPSAADLYVALSNTTPDAADYFTIVADGHFEFTCPIASGVWLKGEGAQVAVLAEAK